jgi:catalase
MVETIHQDFQAARTAFHALHAFRFVKAADNAVYARYHWEPEAGRSGDDARSYTRDRRH